MLLRKYEEDRKAINLEPLNREPDNLCSYDDYLKLKGG